jgi:radical SAM protein with 4Fe4S-binding SPASM domain
MSPETPIFDSGTTDPAIVDLGVTYPAVLSVEVTTNCNLRCAMCALSGSGTRSSLVSGDIGEVVWKRILEVAPRIGYININGWGENFSNPRFLEFLSDLDALEVPVCFTTNGTYMTPEIARRLGELSNLDRITVSIDSPDPHVFRAIRGISLEPVMHGLRSLLENYPRPGDVVVCSVVSDQTLPSLRAFPALLASLGSTNYVLLGLVDNGGSVTRDGLSEELATKIIAEIGTECAASGINFLVHPYLANRLLGDPTSLSPKARAFVEPYRPALKATRQCSSPWEHLFINRNGQVLPCCNCSPWEHTGEENDAILGDLRDQSFDEVWASGRLRSFQDRLRRGDLPGVCENCGVTSTGPHFFDVLSARLELEECQRYGHTFRLAFRNTGAATWTTETHLRIGTTRPRDRVSNHRHRSWLAPNRIVSLLDSPVAPGELGNFLFRIAPIPFRGEVPRPERFQLVAEGVCWLPNTEFELRTLDPSS